MTICVRPGRGHIEKATLRLLPPHGKLRLHLETAKLSPQSATSIAVREGCIDLTGISGKDSIKLTLDYEVFTQDLSIAVCLFRYVSASICQPNISTYADWYISRILHSLSSFYEKTTEDIVQAAYCVASSCQRTRFRSRPVHHFQIYCFYGWSSTSPNTRCRAVRIQRVQRTGSNED